MNIIVGAVIIAMVAVAVIWLTGKFCMHKYQLPTGVKPREFEVTQTHS